MEIVKQEHACCPGCCAAMTIVTFLMSGSAGGVSGAAQHRPVDYDKNGRPWCTFCWDGPVGRVERRLDKLRALAADPGVTRPERENAERRIAEAIAEAKRDVAKRRDEAEERAKEAARRALSERERRACRRISVLLILAAIPVSFLNRLDQTGVFWSLLSLSCSVIGIWFHRIRPPTGRSEIYRAVAVAAVLALLGWLWGPVERAWLDAIGIQVA